MRLFINGDIVPQRTLDAEFRRLSAGLEADAPHAGGISPGQVRHQAMANVVQRTLLLQRAAAEGIRVTQAEADAERRRRWGSRTNTFCGTDVRDAIVEDLLVERVSAQMTRHVPRPGRAQCEAFYHRNATRYDYPEAVRVAHIVCNIHSPNDEGTAAETMQLALARLAKGAAFAKVADLYSDCKGVGGELGWVARGEMVPLFEEVVFALPPGRVSGMFRTEFGLHIARVAERREAGRTPFDRVRIEIANQLLIEERSLALARELRKMEQESEIYGMDDND